MDQEPPATDQRESSDLELGHVPVLMQGVLGLLEPTPGQVCLDCTVGCGGHGLRIAERLGQAGTGSGGRYIGIDADQGNLELARRRLAGTGSQVDLVHGNFADSRAILDGLQVKHVDLLLADIGFASPQMADPDRGFSFMHDGPLDMRLDRSRGRTAADIVNDTPEQELADLIYGFAQERLSRKIARIIVEHREGSPINTTTALAGLVRKAYSRHFAGKRRARRGRSTWSKIDPATRTFMALRIAVNDELGALDRLLEAVPDLLAPGGVAAVISFHSLEDRLVKRAFAGLARQGRGELLTKKPLTASASERKKNPRSRSAKLRGIRLAGASDDATGDTDGKTRSGVGGV